MIVHNRDVFDIVPSCVLLDLDNTLYPYAPCDAAGMAAARSLASRLLNLSAAEFDRCFDVARAEIKQRLPNQGSSHSRLLYFQRTIERAGFASQPFVILQLEQAYWRAYGDVAVLFDNALDFLDDLRIAGIPTAIVTDLTSQVQLRKMILLGLDKVVDWIVSSEESGHDKPHPASFELAHAKLGGVEGPSWMIGDNHHCDLFGAKCAVGAVTLQKVHAGVTKAALHSDYVDAEFEHFADLRKYLSQLLSKSQS